FHVTGVQPSALPISFHRLQSSTAGADGPFDLFVTASWQEQDGFRDHTSGESTRASGNIGIRLSEDVETRFYFGVSDIMQRIPGKTGRASCRERGWVE